VNIYFCRGLSGNNQRRSTCQIYIERNRPYYEKEYSRRLEKIFPRRVGPTGQATGAAAPGPGHLPHLGSQSASTSWILPPPPLRINKKSLMKVGLIQGLWCFLDGYISKAPDPRRNPNSFNSLERELIPFIQGSPRATISIRSLV
jgi:hypothetical protein